MQFSNKKCKVEPYFCCLSFLHTCVGSCCTYMCRVILILSRTVLVLCCLVLLLVQFSRLDHLIQSIVFQTKLFLQDRIIFISSDLYEEILKLNKSHTNCLIQIVSCKTAFRKIWLILKLMTLQRGKQTIIIRIFPNIKQSKVNQTINFGL